MSAGAFVVRRYQCSGLGEVMKIKVLPSTQVLALGALGNNSQAGGVVTLPLFVGVSLEEGELGVRPRLLLVRFLTAPPGYSLGSVLRVPVLRSALWDGAIPGVTEGTYRNRPIRVVGKLPESIL